MSVSLFKGQEDMAKAIIETKRQYTCKNEQLEIITVPDKKDKTVIKLDIQNLACDNKRRHGSAYCQECSDKYKSSGGEVETR